MPLITLPDGSERKFDHPVSVMDVAADIGPGLAKATLAGEVDGKLGSGTREAVKQAQLKIGMPPDSWPTPELLARLRGG